MQFLCVLLLGVMLIYGADTAKCSVCLCSLTIYTYCLIKYRYVQV